MQIDHLDENLNAKQNVKRRFFAMRNGMLADTLRNAGCPYRIIFGLNLPQLREIADAFGYDEALAEELWRNDSTRESRLLAPMLVNPATFSPEHAEGWIAELKSSAEEIDYLCHSLLRKTGYFTSLIEKYKGSDDAPLRYLALRLAFSLLATNPGRTLTLAENELERNEGFTAAIARQLRDDAKYLLE